MVVYQMKRHKDDKFLKIQFNKSLQQKISRARKIPFAHWNIRVVIVPFIHVETVGLTGFWPGKQLRYQLWFSAKWGK